ncbi:MAG: DUF1800 family protein [Verrucomicrobia bacterium]|nr:DUF1800 family protein [Verrucomicrobiota bacterium]
MKTARLIRRLFPLWLMLAAFAGPAAEAPLATSLIITNGRPQLSWTPILGADLYEIYSTPELGVLPFSSDYSGGTTGLTFTRFTMGGENRFFRISATPMSSNNLLAGIALNRLAYGPTPDDLEQLLDRHPVTGLDNSANQLVWTNLGGQVCTGAAAYIAQQLEPWRIPETVTNTHTNIAFIGSKLLSRTQVPVFVVTNPPDGLYGISNQVTNAYYTFSTNAQLADLRAWFIQHAVGAKRQLLEVLLQFFDNHFTTQASKSYDYLSGSPFGVRNNTTVRGAHAYNWEFWEIDGWRQALLNPACTFYDLLKISAESPAQIIYLDTLGSRGDGSNVPNENYARELLELFAMGANNGYEQTDITELAKVWTGWKVGFVHPTNAFNPFTSVGSLPYVQSGYTNCIPGARNVINSNLFAVSTFVYYSAHHRTGSKLLWTNYTSDSTGPVGTTKKVPARFGTDWASDEFKAGYDYSLSMTDTNLTRGTNSIQEGYTVLQRLNDLPFTAENICIKLCRLLVHDNFPSPTTLSNLAEYSYYDYTNPSRTPEAELVRQCLRAWESTTPKGQIWKVVETIVNSDLFRTQAAASQKIKTPLEFTVSAIRALRSSTNGTGNAGSFSAYTDGYALSSTNTNTVSIQMVRLGGMDLFNCSTAAGWPEDGASWLSVAGVIERIRWAQAFCINTGQSGKTDAGNSVTDVRGLIYTKLPPASWTNAVLVADYLVKIIYPTEGRGNVDTYHKMAVTFLNDGSADSNPLDRTKPFSQLPANNAGNSSYDVRLRGAAALLLSLQRFQEQ